MLSENAEELARLLRESIGADKTGVGPDINELLELWGDRDRADLRPALDELANIGFIRINTGMGSAPSGLKRYGLNDVVGVTVLESMQDYLDETE
jgi:hypothetical protein